MAVSETARSRAELSEKLDEYECILSLLNWLDPNQRENINRIRQALPTMEQGDLHEHLKEISEKVSALREDLQIEADANVFRQILRQGKSKKEASLLIPISLIETLIPGAFEKSSRLQALPKHARVALSLGRARSGNDGWVELYILEVKLFEDMAILFNLWQKKQEEDDGSKEHAKEIDALARASVLSAFNLVEAYLNGLAFEYLWENEHSLDEETKGILSEWDPEQERRKYLSLRDKALQFPKLILGVEHPPVQESNCQELEIILGRLKAVRDAVVHASPIPDPITGDLKESSVFGIGFEDIPQLIDAVVDFIKRINQELDKDEESLHWLFARDSEGRFPSEAFA